MSRLAFCERYPNFSSVIRLKIDVSYLSITYSASTFKYLSKILISSLYSRLKYVIVSSFVSLVIETGKMAGLANGSVLVRYGETVVLVNATASKEPKEGIDFFPLSVD
ncbi:MAG: hypothetical protein IKL09_02970, partial [Clostridia bacterium]|nr:hypothetical protein [Clostridia bacterium]